MSDLHLRPTAAELVAAVAEFLETGERKGAGDADRFALRVAANALRTVERELAGAPPDAPLAALARLGFADEQELAAAIRRGDVDDGGDLAAALRVLVLHRLAVAHPGYEQD